ncbi:unnamed protein product, partial [Ixodes pacificus]
LTPSLTHPKTGKHTSISANQQGTGTREERPAGQAALTERLFLIRRRLDQTPFSAIGRRGENLRRKHPHREHHHHQEPPRRRRTPGVAAAEPPHRRRRAHRSRSKTTTTTTVRAPRTPVAAPAEHKQSQPPGRRSRTHSKNRNKQRSSEAPERKRQRAARHFARPRRPGGRVFPRLSLRGLCGRVRQRGAGRSSAPPSRCRRSISSGNDVEP